MILHITPREREIIAMAVYDGIRYREDFIDTMKGFRIANRYRKVLKKILAEEGKA
jgi:tRNA(Ile)-lysidine synthase TilS/MesJ